MSPVIKYSLGRLGIFLFLLVAMLPVGLNILVTIMLAVLVSAVLSYFLLATWRREMAERLASVVTRRQAERQRLRAALAGDEAAAADGDRVADAAPAPDDGRKE